MRTATRVAVSAFVVVAASARASAADLLVSNFSAGAVLRLDATGKVAGTFATVAGPEKVLVAPDGTVWVASYDTGVVHHYSASGTSLGDLPALTTKGEVGMASATGIAIVGGKMWISSYYADEVDHCDVASKTFDSIVAKPTGLYRPHNLFVATDGSVLVSSYPSTLARFNGTTGAAMTAFASGGSLNEPLGTSYGPDGKIYVANAGSNNVLRFDSTGSLLGTFADGGSHGLTHPHDVLFGSDGKLYVTGFTSNNIARFDATTGAFVDIFTATGLSGPSYMAVLPSSSGDAGTDASTADTGTDTGVAADSSVADSAVPDTTIEDSTTPDTTVVDTAIDDTASGDTATVMPVTPQCTADQSSVIDERGTTSCEGFTCVSGKCLRECVATSECVSGYVCNDGRKCVPFEPTASDSGCSYGRSRGSTAVIAASALALLLHRKRRRRED